MSAMKPVLSPLTRCALETEAHVASSGWGQGPRLFALAKNGELLRRQPALASMLGEIDPEEFSAIEQEGLIADESALEKTLGTTAWPADVDGVALAVERVVVPPREPSSPVFGSGASSSPAVSDQGEREDVRLVVAALRDGEIITLVRRKAQDFDDKVAIGTNIAPGLVDALKATLA